MAHTSRADITCCKNRMSSYLTTIFLYAFIGNFPLTIFLIRVNNYKLIPIEFCR